MDDEKMTDEILMAYADGQLSDAEARDVELAAEKDARIRNRIELFKETARQLKAAAQELPPIPDALADRISTMVSEDAKVADFSSHRDSAAKRRMSGLRRWPTAMAASLALVVGLTAGMMIGRLDTPSTPAPAGIALLENPEIEAVLSSAESGNRIDLEGGATINVIASFVDANDTFCREFDYDSSNGTSVASVACRVEGDWKPQIVISTSADQSDTYATASTLDALETWLASAGLVDPLSPEDEMRWLGR